MVRYPLVEGLLQALALHPAHQQFEHTWSRPWLYMVATVVVGLGVFWIMGHFLWRVPPMPWELPSPYRESVTYVMLCHGLLLIRMRNVLTRLPSRRSI